MQVTDEPAFNVSSTLLELWETLTATFTPSETTFGHRLQFVATSSPAQFRVDNVSIREVSENGKLIQKRGIAGMQEALQETAYNFGLNGQEQTLEIVAGDRTIKHQFDRGLYAGSNQLNGYNTERETTSTYRVSREIDANGNATWLNWSESGKHLQAVVDAAGNETAFQYDSVDRLVASLDAANNRSLYFYDGAQRQPQQILITDGQNLVEDGDMEVEGTWEDISGFETANLRPATTCRCWPWSALRSGRCR